jgi:hypothetical protein
MSTLAFYQITSRVASERRKGIVGLYEELPDPFIIKGWSMLYDLSLEDDKHLGKIIKFCVGRKTEFILYAESNGSLVLRYLFWDTKMRGFQRQLEQRITNVSAKVTDVNEAMIKLVKQRIEAES